MKALNIIATAYRATLEEQDDTIVWLTHAMKGAGGEVDVLMRGGAVNYAVAAQDVLPLAIGEREQHHAPDIAGEVARLIDKGVRVYLVREDLEQRGIDDASLMSGMRFISNAELPALFAGYDQVWHW